VVILGTPVEGFRPAKETLAFVNGIPQTNGKKAVLFCTCALWNGSTFGTLSRLLRKKGYECILKVSKRKVIPGQTDFSEVAEKVEKALEHTQFVNWFSSRSERSKKERALRNHATTENNDNISKLRKSARHNCVEEAVKSKN
jgi:hypothetical protein